MSTPSPRHQRPAATGQPGALARPKAVDTAFQLVLAGIVLGAIGTVITTLLDHERLVGLVRDMLSRTGEPYTEADVLGLIGGFRLAGGLAIIVFSALLLVVALRMRAGRNWARLALTGFALLEVANFLSAVAATGAALDLIWSLAGAAFTVAAMVYLFQPDSAKFFTTPT